MTLEEVIHMIGHVEEAIKVKEGQLRDLYINLATLKATQEKLRYDAYASTHSTTSSS